MYWDPEVESPATIAVIGAGPVGIEAALYARFLGFNVDIFDAGRPARNATLWHQRILDVAVRDCTTPLGLAALGSQDENYQAPDNDRHFTGQQFADEYLLALAKSDLLVDSIHINSSVVEVSRLRVSLDDRCDLQERCNDEFRLLIQSRDRGFYTSRADIVIDCRGSMGGTCGWGPAGSQSIGAAESLDRVYQWLPCAPRFEIRDVQSKQTILFGQSDTAIRFAQEWSKLLEKGADPIVIESLRKLAPIQSPVDSPVAQTTSPSLDLKLIWLIPSVSPNARAEQIATMLSAKHSDPKRFSVMAIRGIERVACDENGRWTLELLLADDSTVELTGDVFAPFPNARPTPSIGPELLSQELAFRSVMESGNSHERQTYYHDSPGWRIATQEPHYYRLGSLDRPRDPNGLPEAHQQIRDLFALLGARADLNLYDIVEGS